MSGYLHFGDGFGIVYSMEKKVLNFIQKYHMLQKEDKVIAGSGEGNPNYATSELNIPVGRAESFEGGDARFLSRWKLRTVNQDTYYQGLAKGYFNGAGLTTCEVYLITLASIQQMINKCRIRLTRSLDGPCLQHIVKLTRSFVLPLQRIRYKRFCHTTFILSI